MSRTATSGKALVSGAFFFASLLCVAPIQAASGPECRTDRVDGSYAVKHVYDGDTIRLENGDKVRLIGINTPELGRNGKPSEPYSRKARNRLEQLLRENRSRVSLRRGVESRDRYGRQLAHAYLADRRSLAAIMLREGLAARVSIPPNLYALDCYRRAESVARNAALGIWSQVQWRGVRAKALPGSQRGFALVRGTVGGVRHQGNSLTFTLDGKLLIRIPAAYREHFGGDFPGDLVGHDVVVRGWIGSHRGRQYMHLKHPAALARE